MNNPNEFRTLAAWLSVATLLLTSAASALADARYVDVKSTNATPPYTSWSIAATNIQDAVDAAVAGDEVVVTNGTYATGGRDGSRVKVDKQLMLRSVNGPQFTIIDGGYDGRCGYLTNSAALCGFTLTNGAADVGGGVFCESRTSVISKCVLSGNVAKGAAGGGAYGGTLNDCTLTGNSAEAPLGYEIGGRFPRGFYAGDASGGGAAYCTLNDCTLTDNSARAPFNYAARYGGAYGGRASGGGAAWCVLSNCTLAGNVAQTPFNSVINGSDRWPLPWSPGAYAGGVYDCTTINCTLTNNSASGYAGPFNDRPVNIYGYGGGALDSMLDNCAVSGNSASTYGGGTYHCTLANCTLAGNYYDGALSSTLINCALTGNSGAGASDSTLTNCTLTGNYYGALSSTLINCALIGNSVAGAGYSTLNNCTLTGNGQGAGSSTLNNCIVYFNGEGNWYSAENTLNHCCTTPLPTNGVGNITNAPLFGDTNGWVDLRLQSNSPCINAGNNSYVTSATDLDGNPRIVGGTVDIGAYEFQAVRYVNVNSTNATPPYSTWSIAAANIQDAVDAAVAGDEIVVTNGIYVTGGRTAISWDSTFNRVVVEKPVSIRSINGPQFTVIDGRLLGRCAYLVNGASLSGFTLTNGLVFPPPYQFFFPIAYGGGAYGGTLNNCTLTGNSVNVFDTAHEADPSNASAGGGGAAYCTLNNCTLIGNSARGTNNSYSYLGGRITVEGGGSYCCTLNNCTLSGNSVFASIFGGPLNTQFDVLAQGGGAYYDTLNNCTLISNSVGLYIPPNRFADVSIGGGGAAGCKMTNCIASFNKRITARGRVLDDNLDSLTIQNCWVDSDPLFVDLAAGNLRLQSNSPCINAGLNASAPTGPDPDGNPRIAGGTVDIGAYEFQSPVSLISYAWLQQFGLAIDLLTDAADPDGDGVDNYHEWLSGTSPTNRFSSPAQLIIIPSSANVILTWSTNAVGFALQSTTNLASPAAWSTSPAPFVSNGLNIVTNSISGVQQFYRLSQ